MENLKIPEGYFSPLTIRETEVAIKEVKDHFERALAKSLHLTRVSAPLFVRPESGMNDNLNGVERPVSFGIKEQGDAEADADYRREDYEADYEGVRTLEPPLCPCQRNLGTQLCVEDYLGGRQLFQCPQYGRVHHEVA